MKSSKLSPRKTVQIVKSVRYGKRVAQTVVQHVGVAQNEEHLEELKSLARKLLKELEERESPSIPGLLPEDDSSEWERPVEEHETVRIGSLRNLEQATEGPMEVVESLFSSLGFDGVFGMSSRGRGSSNVLKECLACALVSPSSKAGMSRWLLRHSGKELPSNRIYRMMDGLSERTEKVKRIVSREATSLPGTSRALMLFDVTTLYFESFEPDELRRSGYSKDNKIKETQVVLALAVTPEGFPLWYELFPGNTFEGHTLLPVLKKCGEDLSPEETVVVADRAMFTEENLRMLEDEGYSYVVSAKLRGMSESVKKHVLSAENYTPLPERNIMEDLAEDAEESEVEEGRTEEEPAVSEKRSGNGEKTAPSFRAACWCALPVPPKKEKKVSGGTPPTAETDVKERKRTLVATWSPKRARKDASDREKLLSRLEKKLGTGGGVKGKSLVANRGTSKYLTVKSGEEQDVYVVDAEKIEKDEQWDGLHGVITNLKAERTVEVERLLDHYASLWRIEEFFRLEKHDLSIRPVYHWTPRRIEAHVAMSYMAFALLRHLQHRVQLRQNVRMSAADIREALLDVQSTIMKDAESGKMYRFPKRTGETAKKIYRSLGIRRSEANTEVLSMRKYRNRKIGEATPESRETEEALEGRESL